MVLFNEETLKKLGKSFRIFVCIANPSSSILLSGWNDKYYLWNK